MSPDELIKMASETATVPSEFRPHYYPDFEGFLERKGHRHACLRSFTFPDHLPKSIDSALSWQGSELKQSDYIFQFSEEHLQEIDGACSDFISALHLLSPLKGY